MTNKVILVGNATIDPIIRELDGGNQVANFSVATNERWKDKNGEMQQKTEFHKIVAWGGLAKFASYITKGSMVYVEGQLQTRKWQDKEGKDNYTTEIVLQGFNAALKILSKKEGKDVNSYDRDDPSSPRSGDAPF